MQGVPRTRVLLLGGSCMDQEVEGSCLWGTPRLHACRSGMQGVLRQEAEMLPA